VAISAADLWQAGNPARLLNDYETQLLKSFPGWNGATVAPANPNDSWMSVLAALAHEVGHVRWAQTTIPNPGGDYDFGLLINLCSAGDFFAGWNYNHADPQHRDLQPAGRWRPFRNRSNASGHAIDHSQPPYLNFFLNGLDNPLTSNSDLWTLYQPGQPWASLFAAQTPDEDFVESYVMAVLTGYNTISNTFAGPLTSMPANIPGTPSWPDVASDLVTGKKLQPPANPGLQNKISCVPL
jgi:hypothetical protein